MHIFILHNHFIALISLHSFHFIAFISFHCIHFISFIHSFISFIELCNFAFYFVTFIHVTNTKPILSKTKPNMKKIFT